MGNKQTPTLPADIAINTDQVAQDALLGAHSWVHVWPDVWPTESHEDEACFGPQQGARPTRCTTPEVVPAPRQPSLGSPGPVRVAGGQCPMLNTVVARCRQAHLACGWVGWLEHTHSSFNCPPNPRLTFLTSSIQQRLVARTYPHRNPPTTVAAARSNPLYRHRCPVSIDTPGLGRGIGSSIWQSGGPERAQPQLACVAALEPYQIVIVSNLAPVHPAILAWLLLFPTGGFLSHFFLACPVTRIPPSPLFF